jgi:hypothetical protein
MPRRNRVTPFGEIFATPERGTMMGNRGRLHDPSGQILRSWRLKQWLICELEFRGRQRTVMAPNRYTELFFLDEATALSAGHRPCYECRRARFLDFRAAWARGNSVGGEPAEIRVAMIDSRLHAERIGPDGPQRGVAAKIDELPDGTFLCLDGVAWLLWHDNLLKWSPAAYRERIKKPCGVMVSVLTPQTTVAALSAGYVPQVHSTARRS